MALVRVCKVLYIDELIDLQCWTMLYSKFISCNCNFSKFWCGLGKEFPRVSKRTFEAIIHFQSTYLCKAWFSSLMTMKQNIDLDWLLRMTWD